MADYTLLPASEPVDPDEMLAAAEQEALADLEDTITANDPPKPYGRSWAFDFTTGQFIRHGLAAAETHHFDTLRMWIQSALLTRRFAHVIYSDNFGLEMDDDLVGNVLTPELEADSTVAIETALLAHDRIASVGDFAFEQSPDEDFVAVSFTVTTDSAEQLEVAQVPLLTGGAV